MKKLLCVLMFGLIFGRSSSSETYTNSSQVELEIDSESVVVENAGAGTLDIIMQNYPGCKDFCVDPSEEELPNCFNNGEYACVGKTHCILAEGEWYNFVREDEIDPSECSGYKPLTTEENPDGEWFNGHIGGFQFELIGIVVSGAAGGTAETAGFIVNTSPTTVIGFSMTGATIPPGVNQLLTTVNFTGYNEESSICFGEDTGSSGGTAISDANANYIAAAWGDCYCPDVNPADICGECGGSGIPDGECDCDGNVDLGCGCGEAGPSGCDNACGSNLEFDECGECGGSGIPDGECDCDGNVDDCAGECGGDAVLNGCDNTCNSTAVEDCAGVCGGASLLDCCGVCNGDNDSCELPAIGDLNDDGEFNVLDIVTLANCVISDTCNNMENGCAGDLNGDGGYNVLDIVTLANCILNLSCGD